MSHLCKKCTHEHHLYVDCCKNIGLATSSKCTWPGCLITACVLVQRVLQDMMRDSTSEAKP